MTPFHHYFLVFLILSPSAVGEDWPHWMGPNRNGAWDGDLISEFPENSAKILFRQPINAGYAGPSIVDGRIYVMDRVENEGDGLTTENNIASKGAMKGSERVLCLDATSGKQIWKHTYDCPYRIAYPTGPRCTPTVDGKLVYTLGAMGDLKCLKCDSGEVVWEKKLTEDYNTKPPLWGFASHPLVDGKQLLVPVGGKNTAVVSFEKLTGKQLWASTTTKDIGYSPLVIREPQDGGQRQMIFWHSDGVTSLNPADGAEFWFEKFPEKPSPSVVTISTPIFEGDRLLLTDFYAGAIALTVTDDPPAAKVLWRNASNPEQRKSMMNCMMSTALIRDGLVYGVAHNGRGHGVLRCVSLDDGNLVWESDTWANGKKSLLFAHGFFAENKDRVFIFNDLGDLLITKMNKDGFEEVSRAHILEPTSAARGRDVVWSAPAFANGRMVVRNDKEIVCVDLTNQ